MQSETKSLKMHLSFTIILYYAQSYIIISKHEYNNKYFEII